MLCNSYFFSASQVKLQAKWLKHQAANGWGQTMANIYFHHSVVVRLLLQLYLIPQGSNHLLRMVSWNLNNLRFGSDCTILYTLCSSSDVRWARIPKDSQNNHSVTKLFRYLKWRYILTKKSCMDTFFFLGKPTPKIAEKFRSRKASILGTWNLWWFLVITMVNKSSK